MPTFSICAPAGQLTSLVGELTNAETPPHKALSPECGVIILSRVLRGLNRMQLDSFEELASRRECAALLQNLRLDIQREAALAGYP